MDEAPFTTKTIERGVSRTTDDASDSASELVSCSGSSPEGIKSVGGIEEPKFDWDAPGAGPPPPNKDVGWLAADACAGA